MKDYVCINRKPWKISKSARDDNVRQFSTIIAVETIYND